VLGAVLLGLTTATAVLHIMVGDAVRASLTGSDQHGLALLVLAALALALTGLAVASRGGAVLAGLVGLGVVGLAVLGLWALGDRPDAGDRGTFGAGFEAAQAHTAIGFWLELGAALSLLTACIAGLIALTPGRAGGARRPGRDRDRP
jgi:hypothetical protein